MQLIKQNDRRPAATAILRRGRTPVDLTLAGSVKFKLRYMYKNELKVDAGAVIVEATTGEVEYRWLSGQTDEPGVYLVEWEVRWGDNTTETFPTIGYDVCIISGDLDS